MADIFNSHAVSETQEISETTDLSSFQDSVTMKDDNLVAISENSKKLNMAISEKTQEFGNTHLPKVKDFVIQSGISLAADDESTKKDGFLDENLVAISENSNKLNVAISEIQEFGNTQLVDDEESIKKYGFLDGNKGESLNLEKNLVGVSENSKKLNVAISENLVVIPESSQEFGNTHLAKVKDNGEKDGLLNGEKGKSLNLEDKCRLKIEVIDDTAMIDISQLGKTFVNTTKKKRVCSRKELEDMRYIGMEQQKKTWVEVYCGLCDVVRKEYDGLLHQSNNKQKAPRRHRGKENTPNVISGNHPLEHLDDQEGNIDSRNSPLAFPLRRDDGISYEEGESNVYEESDDSDDDYSSIQRPAFKVTGEPDFDSGPPEDGLEYLRRVRWEAAQFPKVKVVKVEGSKLNKEQMCYMPQIPDIASCPEHLLPLKEWEESFLADFSELRQALSRLEADVGTSSQLHSATFVHQHSSQLPEGIVLDKFDGLMSGEDESCLSDAGDDPALGNSTPKSSPAGVGNIPTLSVILRMDAVARVSILRKQITAVQSMSSLSRDDCLWLFVLCAAVDTPLDADTCAALRSLLRKCASLRAEKSELDDEVIMLNILATISGRYFGQSEQRKSF